MKNLLKQHRFLILRRILQLGLLTLFAGGNYLGLKILNGNYSSAVLLDSIKLTDPFAYLQMLASGYIGASSLLIGAATILIVYSILGGRVFCGWICPVNLITDSARRLRKILNFQDKKKIKLSRNSRYYILLLSLILSTILGFAAFEMISPISILHRGIIFGFGAEIALVVAIFLFDLTILKDGWCGHLCPLGAFYSVSGKFGLIKVRHTKDNCTSCMKCFEVCPEKQILSIVTVKDGLIKSGECLNCGRCVEVCSDRALNFSVNNYKKDSL